MARRRRDNNTKSSTFTPDAYGGVRSTPRTRSPTRTVTTRVAAPRDPLDAIGGRFFEPDLTAWDSPDFSAAAARRAPVNQAIAKAAAPANRSQLVSPSKRRQNEALFKAPDPFAKKRSANEFAKAPTRTRLKAMGLDLAAKAPPRRSEGLGRKLTGILSRLAPLPSPAHSRAASVRKVTPRGTLTEFPQRSSHESVTGRTAAHQRPATEHAERVHPRVREDQASSRCKPRPDPHQEKRTRGSGGSREFVPWCDRHRR